MTVRMIIRRSLILGGWWIICPIGRLPLGPYKVDHLHACLIAERHLAQHATGAVSACDH